MSPCKKYILFGISNPLSIHKYAHATLFSTMFEKRKFVFGFYASLRIHVCDGALNTFNYIDSGIRVSLPVFHLITIKTMSMLLLFRFFISHTRFYHCYVKRVMLQPHAFHILSWLTCNSRFRNWMGCWQWWLGSNVYHKIHCVAQRTLSNIFPKMKCIIICQMKKKLPYH